MRSAIPLLLVLPHLLGGCRKDCEDERPGFLLEVALPGAVDPAGVSCLLLWLDLGEGPRPHVIQVRGKLGDRRTSVAFVNVAPSAFGVAVTLEACESCPEIGGESRCNGRLAGAQRTFSGSADACNRFEVDLAAGSGDGPLLGDGRLDLARDLGKPAEGRKPDTRKPDLFAPVPGDMTGHTAEEKAAVQWLLGRKLLTPTGCTPGWFCPSFSVKRREVARAVMGWRFGVPPGYCGPASGSFPDVASGDPDYGYIQCAKDSGGMAGDGSGNFNPDSVATRFHAAKPIAALKFGTTPTSACNSALFTDLDAGQCPFVTKLTGVGVVTGSTCPTSCTTASCFCPYAELTRLNLALWLYRADKL